MSLTYPIDALVSFHYFRNETKMKSITSSDRLRLIGDSGAFSAYTQGTPIQLGEYAEWCMQWQNKLCWIAALDVIGDGEVTYKNWKVLRDKYHLNTVPTLHAGGDTKWLDVYASEGVNFIGLGGLVGVTPRAFRWLVHVFRYAREHHPEMRFHAWGMTNSKILETLPIYSVDSSGIIGQPYRYAYIRLFDPYAKKIVRFELNGRDPLTHRRLLTEVYGIEPKQIMKSSPSNRSVFLKLTAMSVQQYTAWLQSRHHVSSPLQDDLFIGPRIHVAEQLSDLMSLLV